MRITAAAAIAASMADVQSPSTPMSDRSVLLMANSAWNLANFRRPIIEALVAQGVPVIAAAPADGAEDELRTLGVRFHALPVDAGGTSPVADLRLLFATLRLLRAERPGTVLTFTVKPNIYGSLAAQLLGIPSIATVSGLGSAFLGGGRVAKLVERLFRHALRKARTVFFQNSDDRAVFVERGMVRADQTRLVAGSGIDLDRFKPAPAPPSSRFRFLFIGRMLTDKGLRELAEAVAQLRSRGIAMDIDLLGPGGGSNPSAIADADLDRWTAQGLFRRLGPTDDVRPYIAQSHCVVLPSYREGLPRSLLEGAAMERPLVATDVPGCRDLVIEGETGLLCDVRSGPDLARAMEAMVLLSDERRRAMGEAGRRLVEERYDQRSVARAYLEALKR